MVMMVLCRFVFVIVALLSFFQPDSSVSAQSAAPATSDCGWPSIDEITCDYYGCCWTTINSTAIGCFNATNDTTTTMPPTTTVVPTTTTVVTTALPTTTTLPPTTTTVVTTGPMTSTPATTQVTTSPKTSNVVATTSPTMTSSAVAKDSSTATTPGTTFPNTNTMTIGPLSTTSSPNPLSGTNTINVVGTSLATSTPGISSNTMTLSDGGAPSSTVNVDTGKSGTPLTKSTANVGHVVSTTGTAAAVNGSDSAETLNPQTETIVDQALTTTQAITVNPPGQQAISSDAPSTVQATEDITTLQLKNDQDTTTVAASAAQDTTPVACVNQWTNHSTNFILGGTYYSQFSSSSDACLNACANIVMECVAANVFFTQDSTILCLLHTDLNDLKNVFSTSNGSVHVLEHRCITYTTVSPFTGPTEKPNCHSMTWLNSSGICCNGAMSTPDYKTVDDCLNACSCLVSDCIAAFVRNTTDGDGGIQCFMNLNSGNLGDLWPCPSVTQYVLLGSDAQGLTTAVPPTQSPSTTMGMTTVGLVDYAICWHPPTISNATVMLFKDVYGLVAIYTCYDGYIFTYGGTSRVNICKGNEWLIKIPGCAPVTCDVSSSTKSLAYSGFSIPFDAGDVRTTMCPAEGQRRFLDGSKVEEVKCTVENGRNGTLLKPLSGCKNGRCVAAPVVTNTTAVYDGATQTLYLTCIIGHRFQKGMTKQQFNCLTDGTWPDIGACKAIFCPVLPPLTNGSYSTDDVVYGTVVTSRCDVGYIFPDHNNSRVFKCTDGVMEDAEWNETRNDPCQAVICTDPLPPVPNESTSSLATGSQTIFHYLEFIKYDCLGGRKFTDGTVTQNVVCSANAFWSVDEVSCDYNRCDPVPVVTHATPSSRRATKNSLVVYTCDVGFWFSRNITQKSTVCDGANWSPVDKECVPVTCPQLNLSNADVNMTDNTYEAIADVRCRPGYLFNGSVTVSINCTAAGLWSVNVICKPLDCGENDAVSNAILELSSIATTYGNTATYHCIEGYWFSRESTTMTSVCDATGHWSVNGVAGANHWRTCSAITCLPLIQYVANTTDDHLGIAVNVSCLPGYRFPNSKISDMEAVCKNMGAWYPDIPDCISADPNAVINLPITEAAKSDVIAGVAISFVVLGFIAVLFFDWSRLMVAFSLLAKNARSSCSSSPPS